MCNEPGVAVPPAFIERRGWALVDTFVDHRVSGSREKRPELDRIYLLMHLVSAFSEFERQVLIEWTRAGLAAARRRDACVGRPRVVVDRDELLRLRDDGLPLRRIAEKFGVRVATVHCGADCPPCLY